MIVKSNAKGTYSILGITNGKLLAIRNGLGYAIHGGFATPLQAEVYVSMGRILKDIGVDTGLGRILKDIGVEV